MFRVSCLYVKIKTEVYQTIILPVVDASVILEDVNRLRVAFDRRVLRIFWA
jgi:hypothetical protein